MQFKLIEVQQNKVVKAKRSKRVRAAGVVQPTLWRAILIG